jgi:hypothetical protein
MNSVRQSEISFSTTERLGHNISCAYMIYSFKPKYVIINKETNSSNGSGFEYKYKLFISTWLWANDISYYTIVNELILIQYSEAVTGCQRGIYVKA